MFQLFISACGLGLAYSAAPGAVNTEALKRGLQRGFLASFAVQIGAFLGDLVWAVVGLTGAALIFRIVPIRIVLAIAGATFLFRLAWLSFTDARRPIDISGEIKGTRDFITGTIFSLANPFGIAFWGGIGGGFVVSDTGTSLIERLLWLLSGFAVGAIVWCVGISLVIAWARKFVGAKILRSIYILASVSLAYYALEMLWNTWHSILSPMIMRRIKLN